LYGQFIEHIGDIVIRSVWAEMVDDRKFYYTVDSKTAAPRGIAQAGIVLRKGQAYTGRVVPAGDAGATSL